MSFTGFMGMEMNEKIFAEMQKASSIVRGGPWFTNTYLNPLPPLNLSNKRNGDSLTHLELKQYIFAKIFGTDKLSKDLTEAEQLCLLAIKGCEGERPMENLSNDDYGEWLNNYGGYQILLGTTYAYMDEYIKAVYHLMRGLKCESVSLNMPYCDFIRYCISKLPNATKQYSLYNGHGHSSSYPMGFLYDQSNKFLIANTALDIIPQMEGKNGEIIVAHQGQYLFYGTLERRGSVSCPVNNLMIDVYNTILIDKNYNIYQKDFYFNGYMSRNHRSDIVVADGFRMKPNSKLIYVYNFF